MTEPKREDIQRALDCAHQIVKALFPDIPTDEAILVENSVATIIRGFYFVVKP